MFKKVNFIYHHHLYLSNSQDNVEGVKFKANHHTFDGVVKTMILNFFQIAAHFGTSSKFAAYLLQIS